MGAGLLKHLDENSLSLQLWLGLVDCPTQLICTWIFICSMTKLKEHSREICQLSICSWTRSSSAQKTLLWGFRFCCPLSERPASDIQRTLRECNLGSPRNSDRDQPTISQDLSGDQPRISKELPERATQDLPGALIQGHLGTPKSSQTEQYRNFQHLMNLYLLVLSVLISS